MNAMYTTAVNFYRVAAAVVRGTCNRNSGHYTLIFKKLCRLVTGKANAQMIIIKCQKEYNSHIYLYNRIFQIMSVKVRNFM
jgi:hypothetical protein